jgi:hypothetical protein
MELLFGLAFRYGAVELAKFVKLLQPLPRLVKRCMGTGHGLSRCCGSFLYLGMHSRGRVWRFPHLGLFPCSAEQTQPERSRPTYIQPGRSFFTFLTAGNSFLRIFETFH